MKDRQALERQGHSRRDHWDQQPAGRSRRTLPLSLALVRYNADGQSDILWRGDTGRVGLWLSGSSQRGVEVGTVPAGWTFAGTLLDRVF